MGRLLKVTFQTRSTGPLLSLREADERISSVLMDDAFRISDEDWLISLTVTTTAETDLKSITDGLSGIRVLNTALVPGLYNHYRLDLLVREFGRFVVDTVTRAEAIPMSVVQFDECVEVSTLVEDWDHLQAFSERIESSHGSFDLHGVTEVTGNEVPFGGARLRMALYNKLTPDQLQLLETAYWMGYFEVPQGATASEIASELDIGQSTFSERYRAVQRRVCEALFGTKQNKSTSVQRSESHHTR